MHGKLSRDTALVSHTAAAVVEGLKPQCVVAYYNKLCGRQPQYAPPAVTFDLLTLKMMFESRVTWATSVPNLVFLGFSFLDLGSMYATDRQSDRQTSDNIIA